MRLPAHVRHHRRLAGLGHPTGDALAHLHRHLADHVLVQPVGRGQKQVAIRQQVERAHVGPDGRGRLADDQLKQLIRALGRRRGLGQADEKAQFAGGQARVGGGCGHLHAS